MNFQSYQPNLENMKQYLSSESEKSSGSSTNWWSFPAGMSSVRILPPWDPTGRVALPVFMHPIEYKGEGMSFTKYNWTCVNKTFSKPCPICDGLTGMSAAGVDTSKWEASRRQYYFNAIVMHDPTYDNKDRGTAPGTHVLLKAPKTFYDWVISQITNPMIGDITSITDGIDIYVTKEGQGLGTSYNMTLSPNGRTPIPQEYLSKVTELYNLDDVFSTGFDQQQIEELVNHLKKSAGVMSNSLPSMQQQMAGYPQAPVNPQMTAPSMPNSPYGNQVPPMPNSPYGNQVPPMPNSPYGNQVPPMPNSPYGNQVPTAPMTPPAMPASPYGSQADPTVPPVQSPTLVNVPAVPSTQSDNLPKCFGQYDPGSVNCVVCPKELDCSKVKNG